MELDQNYQKKPLVLQDKHRLKINRQKYMMSFVAPEQTLPKALRTQALTALISNFGLLGLVGQVWFGRFGLVSLIWWVWFGRFGLLGLVW